MRRGGVRLDLAVLASREMTERSVVVRVLADSPAGLCLQCIAGLAGITLERAERDTTDLICALRAVPTIGRCSVCTAGGTVYRLG